MAKFQMNVVVDNTPAITARVGDSTTAGTVASPLLSNPLLDADVGKLVKMIGDSQYGLCAVGNEIEGQLVAMNTATQDGYYIGAVQQEGRMKVTLDGLQATPGTGTVAVGDYVVCGTITARGTVLPGAPKVCKATAAATGIVFKWRVVALLGGVGTVGALAIIEQVG